jgi:alkylhydroperoxidase/carboxymuconolactone decarboxylase family protein YurZ
LACTEFSTASSIETSGLDARSHAMVRLAAAVTAGDCGEQGSWYEQQIDVALDHGVSLDEIVGIFVALLPMVSADRITTAATALLQGIQSNSSFLARRTASPR